MQEDEVYNVKELEITKLGTLGEIKNLIGLNKKCTTVKVE